VLDDLRSSLECGALGVPNNPNLRTENSQRCDYCTSVKTENIYATTQRQTLYNCNYHKHKTSHAIT